MFGIGTNLKRKVSLIKKKLIGNSVIGVIVKTNQGVFALDSEDIGVSRKLIKYGSYGTDEISRLVSIVAKEDDILFVGGHIGAIVIPIAPRVNHVTVIEANPSSYQFLKANVALNNLSNVSLIQIAANNKKEKLEFVLNKANSGGSKRMPIIKAREYFCDKPKVQKVSADRLDDVLKNKSYKLIFMDIEGSEYYALQGMQNLLKKANVLIMEFMPYHIKNISQATVEDFLSLIQPHFNTLTIPSKNLTIQIEDSFTILEKMYQTNEFDNGIIFKKQNFKD